MRSPFEGHALLFDEKNLSFEDAKKWPNVLLFGIMNSENMSNHSSTKNFGKFQCKQRPADMMTFFWSSLSFWGIKMDICGHDDFFFGLHLFLGKKMDICGHDDLFFWSSLAFGKKNRHLRT